MLEELEERGWEQQEELQLDLTSRDLASSICLLFRADGGHQRPRLDQHARPPGGGRGLGDPILSRKIHHAHARAQKVGLTPVTEAELFSFLFPRGCSARRASRLFLFARYGPLVHGQIVGGSYKRHRALTKQELNDLIEQDEREELPRSSSTRV